MYSFDYIRQSNRHSDFWKTVTSFHNMDLLFIENFFMGFYNITAFSAADETIVKLFSDIVTKNCTVKAGI